MSHIAYQKHLKNMIFSSIAIWLHFYGYFNLVIRCMTAISRLIILGTFAYTQICLFMKLLSVIYRSDYDLGYHVPPLSVEVRRFP